MSYIEKGCARGGVRVVLNELKGRLHNDMLQTAQVCNLSARACSAMQVAAAAARAV